MKYNERETLAENNRASITGTVMHDPEFDHAHYGKVFFKTVVEVTRTSGTKDYLPVIIPEEMLSDGHVKEGSMIRLTGRIQTHNMHTDSVHKLQVYFFARQIEPAEDDLLTAENNVIMLRGTICTDPLRRRTPLGRYITDLIFAVNRTYGRSDYIPCIIWGTTTPMELLKKSNSMIICGRMQSRTYEKNHPDGSKTTETVYEISAATVKTEEEKEEPEWISSEEQKTLLPSVAS